MSVFAVLFVWMLWIWPHATRPCVIQVKVKKGTYKFESSLEDWRRRVREEPKSVGQGQGRLYYQLQQLYPLSYYQLEVRAMNDVGYSEPNPEFIFRTAAGESYCIDIIIVIIMRTPGQQRSIALPISFALCGLIRPQECYYWQPIGSRIGEINWYQNEWPWPLFRGRLSLQILGIWRL